MKLLKIKLIKNLRQGLLLLLILITIGSAFALEFELEGISFDPAIIAAGDDVDIVIQYNAKEAKTNNINEEYKFKVRIEADDDLTKEYVTIVDTEGDSQGETYLPYKHYNKVFRVKVAQNAPTGNYQFRMYGEFYDNGELRKSYDQTFTMNVKKQGIILDLSSIETIPREVKPGDDYVKIINRIENVGRKDAKAVKIKTTLPESLSPSYSDNNEKWIGRVNAGESKEVTFFVDVDDYMSGLFEINYEFEYMDLDDNEYKKERALPFLIKERPYIEVVSFNGSGLSGDTSKLEVIVKNTGNEKAEYVDVRIIKQNAQPFEIEVRSDYIGTLEPGQTGKAIFDIDTIRGAAFKEHDLKLMVRAKGDSDSGDDNIYTFSANAKFNVTGEAENKLKVYGIYAGVAIIVFIILNSLVKVFIRGKKK